MVAARDLEIRHLMALAAVADAGTFGRAADELGYTQSAISQQIAALERVLGEPVFDRPGGPRPVELTPLGEVLLDHARALLDRVDEATNDIERFRAGAIGRIDIGSFQSVLTAVVPAVLGHLRSERPGVDVRLVQEEDNDVLVRRLVEGQLDVSFFLSQDNPAIESIELVVDPFVLVSRREDADGLALRHGAGGNGNAGGTGSEAGGGNGPGTAAGGHGPDGVSGWNGTGVSPHLLHGAPVIAELDNPCQRQIDRGLRDLGVVPDIVFRTNDNTAVSAMVRAGMGMAVMPLLAVEADDERLVVRPLDPPIPPRHISIGWPRGRTLSPAAARFVELAQEVTEPLRERTLAATA